MSVQHLLRTAIRRSVTWLSQISLLPPEQHSLRSESTSSPCSTAGLVQAPRQITLDNMELLSTSPLIIQVSNFINVNSCRHIIKAAPSHGRKWSSTMTEMDVKYQLPTFPFERTQGEEKRRGGEEEETSIEQVLEQVYAEIDNCIGVPRTTQDSCPKLHHYPFSTSSSMPSSTSTPTTSSTPTPLTSSQSLPLGLHIDTNSRPSRYCTAILYLTHLPNSGATVFPVAKRHEDGKGANGDTCDITLTTSTTVVSNEKARAAAASLVRNDILHTNLASKESQRHQESANLLLKAADDDHQGLSVYPEVGKLIIFFTRGDDGGTLKFNLGLDFQLPSKYIFLLPTSYI